MHISSRQQFDRQAPLYASSAVHRHGASLPVLVEYAAVRPRERALDVATGTGNTAFALAEEGCRHGGAGPLTGDARAGVGARRGGRVRRRLGGAPTFRRRLFRSRDRPSRAAPLPRCRPLPYRSPKGAPARWAVRDGGRRFAGRRRRKDGSTVGRRYATPSHWANRTVAEWRDLTADFVWTKSTLVPYRLEFDWWTRQSGCSPERVEELVRHARAASPEVRKAVGLEMEGDRPLAFHEPMLVVRLDRP